MKEFRGREVALLLAQGVFLFLVKRPKDNQWLVVFQNAMDSPAASVSKKYQRFEFSSGHLFFFSSNLKSQRFASFACLSLER